MTRTTAPSLFLFLFIFLTNISIYADTSSIYLCVDSMLSIKNSTGKEPQKLVYGYINGEKTSCMSEHQLRTMISEASHQQNDLHLKKIKRRMLQQNAVFRGEKNLKNADLRGMDLQGVDLSGADLSGAQLESADLRNANLKNANLTGASMVNAYCKNTNLTGANLTETVLNRVFFYNTNLKGATGLSVENLNFTATLYKTKFDDSLSEIVQQNLSSKLLSPKGTWVPTIIDSDDSLSTPRQH